jgi:glycosyltransferase involved in cell wall biosynthesis
VTFALVTPARDEAEHLPRLARAVAAQTRRPDAWVIVDDASSDGTHDVAAELAREHAWVSVLGSPAEPPEVPSGRRAGRDVVAFETGVAALDPLPDVVVKLDADVSFAPGFFEEFLRGFEEDETLGIASARLLEPVGGVWTERHAAAGHVWGAVRGYRSACLAHVSPLERRLGWDGIDLLLAELGGWATRILRGTLFFHHRPEGVREGTRMRAWAAQGWSAWYMGYRPSYLVARAAHQAIRDPAALGLIGGYVRSALAREPRYPEPAVREALRRRQRLRSLPLRLREARGHTSG